MEVDDTSEKYKDDSSDTTEELFVHVNFDELLDECTDEELKNLKILGIDTKEPFLQIGNKVFGGTWKETVGTALFFEETESTPKKCYFSVDVPHPLKFTAKTQKSLFMRRIFVNPKNAATEGEDESSQLKTDGETNSTD